VSAPCPCCDHPLQHAISRVLAAHAAGAITAKRALQDLADDLEEWEAAQ